MICVCVATQLDRGLLVHIHFRHSNKDGVVKLLCQTDQTVRFGKLLKIRQDINHPFL